MKLKLHWQILIALVVAVLFGAYVPQWVKYISWIGDLFLNGLKMIIVPLIMTSIITGMLNVGSGKNLGRLGAKTLGYYLFTSVLAISTGLIAVNLIKPGVGVDIKVTSKVEGLEEASQSFGDTLYNLIPSNVVDAMAKGNVLGLIFFCILFGFFLTQIDKKYREPLSNVIHGIFEVIMKITMFVIKFTPIGVFSLVAKTVSEQTDLVEVAKGLGGYVITVVIALLIHALISLPIFVSLIAKINPFKHLSYMKTALLTAFSTSSSNATLPLTMDTVEHKEGVSNSITSFTLPLGATINMDGTALYECVAAMFIAQIYGMELSILQQIVVLFTALLASIGAAGIPMAGLVMITIILSYVGLPLEAVGIILAVDRPLDMLRTTVNVWSDSCGAVTIAKSEGEKLNF